MRSMPAGSPVQPWMCCLWAAGEARNPAPDGEELSGDTAHFVGDERARSRLMDLAVDNVKTFLAGKPQNVVNL